MIFETNKKRDRDYSGIEFKRGNGTRRLKETIQRCKGAKLQIVSKKDFYQLECKDNMLKSSHKVKENMAIGTLISIELPVKEFLNRGGYDANI